MEIIAMLDNQDLFVSLVVSNDLENYFHMKRLKLYEMFLTLYIKALGDRCFATQPDGTPLVDKSCDCGLTCDEEADDWQAGTFEPAPGIGLCVCNEPNPRLCECRRTVDPDKIKGDLLIPIGGVGKKPIDVGPPVSEKPVKNLRGVESGGK